MRMFLKELQIDPSEAVEVVFEDGHPRVMLLDGDNFSNYILGQSYQPVEPFRSGGKRVWLSPPRAGTWRVVVRRDGQHLPGEVQYRVIPRDEVDRQAA